MLMTPQLTLLLERAVLGGYRMVVVDLSRCAFVGSAGLATFALARKRAQDGDTRTSLVLTGMSRIASRAMRSLEWARYSRSIRVSLRRSQH